MKIRNNDDTVFLEGRIGLPTSHSITGVMCPPSDFPSLMLLEDPPHFLSQSLKTLYVCVQIGKGPFARWARVRSWLLTDLFSRE